MCMRWLNRRGSCGERSRRGKDTAATIRRIGLQFGGEQIVSVKNGATGHSIWSI
jgi:hypothetical protein